MTIRRTRLPDPPRDMPKDLLEYYHDLLRDIEFSFKNVSDIIADLETRLNRVSVLNP